MKDMLKKLVSFLKQDEDGPTTVEYAIILALIIVVCIFAIAVTGTNASRTFGNVTFGNVSMPGGKGSGEHQGD